MYYNGNSGTFRCYGNGAWDSCVSYVRWSNILDPVANLNLYLNLLERGKLEKRAEYMTVLRQQAARLTQLIEDILDLSRLEAGAAQAVFESLDLNELAAQVVSAQRPVAQAKGLVFHFEPEENLPTIRGGANLVTRESPTGERYSSPGITGAPGYRLVGPWPGSQALDLCDPDRHHPDWPGLFYPDPGRLS